MWKQQIVLQPWRSKHIPENDESISAHKHVFPVNVASSEM